MVGMHPSESYYPISLSFLLLDIYAPAFLLRPAVKPSPCQASFLLVNYTQMILMSEQFTRPFTHSSRGLRRGVGLRWLVKSLSPSLLELLVLYAVFFMPPSGGFGCSWMWCITMVVATWTTEAPPLCARRIYFLKEGVTGSKHIALSLGKAPPAFLTLHWQ